MRTAAATVVTVLAVVGMPFGPRASAQDGGADSPFLETMREAVGDTLEIDTPDNAILGRSTGTELTYVPLCGILQFYRGTRMWDPYSLEDIAAAHTEAYPRMRRQLEAQKRSRDLNRSIRASYDLAELHSGQGELDLCIAEAERLVKLLELPSAPPFAKKLFIATAGVAHMRKGEVINCVTNHNAESCIAPLSPAAQHLETEGFEAAKAYFLRYLEMEPDHLAIRWLLNVTAMGLGEYPAQVPPEYYVPMPEPDPSVEIGRFRDVSAALGVNPWTLAGGAITDDFNGDGLLDIVCTTWDSTGNMSYFENDGAGGFVDKTEAAGLVGQLGGLNAVQADYDNDGDLDVLVLRGAWEDSMRNSLLANDGTGRFTDVTESAGLLRPATPTQTAAWADYDHDGDLDLFVGNESVFEPHPCQLFRNNGDGTFTDVAPAAGVDVEAFVKGCDWGDFDNDGDEDLFVSNMQGDNSLFRNNGDGTFDDATRAAGVVEPGASFACWFFDYDNDGWLDLFVAAYDDPLDTYRCFIGEKPVGEIHVLYRNQGDGTFADVTRDAGLGTACMTMGANFGDLDNDGWLDMYLATGSPPFGDIVPNAAFLNMGGASFTDVTVPTGLGHLQKGHAIAFGDLDNDGDQDIYAQLGGAVASDGFANGLFENPGHGNAWITLRFVGTQTNRSGLGVRVMIDVIDGDGERSRRSRVVGSDGSFGSSSLQQEIGLGRDARIERLEVQWPVSGTTKVFRDVPANKVISITEGADAFEVVDVPRLEFKTGAGHHHHH